MRRGKYRSQVRGGAGVIEWGKRGAIKREKWDTLDSDTL